MCNRGISWNAAETFWAGPSERWVTNFAISLRYEKLWHFSDLRHRGFYLLSSRWGILIVQDSTICSQKYLATFRGQSRDYSL